MVLFRTTLALAVLASLALAFPQPDSESVKFSDIQIHQKRADDPNVCKPVGDGKCTLWLKTFVTNFQNGQLIHGIAEYVPKFFPAIKVYNSSCHEYGVLDMTERYGPAVMKFDGMEPIRMLVDKAKPTEEDDPTGHFWAATTFQDLQRDKICSWCAPERGFVGMGAHCCRWVYPCKAGIRP